MPGTINRIKTQIDFSATRGHAEASLIYTVLMRYNRGGSTEMTASQLIAEAFRKYDATEPVDLTLFYDVRNRACSFRDTYNIESKSDIMRVIKDASFTIEPNLLEPGKKYFCFDEDDSSVKEMWNYLAAIRFRDRGCVINRYLYQYFAHGNSDVWNSLCVDRSLYWMKEEYETMYNIDKSRLDVAIDIIWRNSRDDNNDEIDIIDEDGAEETLSVEDRLRKVMGLL